MADAVDIDLYADVDHEFAQEDGNYNSTDLYDDMLQPSSRASGSRQTSSNGLTGMQYNYQGKKVSIYIGNLTWWTTDKDLQKAIASLGVTDLIEIKFYENRANGQSKGFALVHLQSESSSRIIMEKLPQKDLHGQSPVVTPCNRQSLNQFEQQSKAQSGGGGGSSAPPAKTATPVAAPPPVQAPAAPQFSQPPPALPTSVPPVGLPAQTRINQPPPSVMPPALPAGFGRLPPPINVPPPRAAITIPPPGVRLPGVPPPRMVPPPGLPPPAAIIRTAPPPRLPPSLVPPPRLVPPPTSLAGVNTRVPPPIGVLPPGLPQHFASLPPPMSGPPPALPILPKATPVAEQRLSRDSYRAESRSQSPPLTEPEIEEIMIRNRAVSSSAISRAVSDASSGDYGSAIETLVTAISLIKQSKVAGDERAKVLIGSLQDCLHGIEEKSFGSGGGGGGRKRDRSRDREERSRHRESKSRRRDRDRDRSRSRDRYEEREYRDRSRERESGGGSYSRHSDRDRHRR